MIEKINANCKKLNDLFGVNVKLPNPSKRICEPVQLLTAQWV